MNLNTYQSHPHQMPPEWIRNFSYPSTYLHNGPNIYHQNQAQIWSMQHQFLGNQQLNNNEVLKQFDPFNIRHNWGSQLPLLDHTPQSTNWNNIFQGQSGLYNQTNWNLGNEVSNAEQWDLSGNCEIKFPPESDTNYNLFSFQNKHSSGEIGMDITL